MDIAKKIKQLRAKAGLTQEQLAEKLGISAQSVSKWENAVTMPDITLLPLLAGEFGVTIDELFDLTVEQRLHRLERRLDVEEEFPSEIFHEYEEFLKAQLTEYQNSTRIYSLLAQLYHHRMNADAKRTQKYARAAIMQAPEKKDCQWLLQAAEGASVWDWNMANHTATIEFYKEVIARDPISPHSPLPYYELMDNLIADHRAEEARQYLEIYQTLPAHKPFLVPVYRAHIALAEYDAESADAIMEEALGQFENHSGFLFEYAQYHARKCEYQSAIDCYERAWALEEDGKPRYTDALHGIATIYEILGDYRQAAQTYDRMLVCLRDEWGYQADDVAVREAEQEKQRLLNKMEKDDTD